MDNGEEREELRPYNLHFQIKIFFYIIACRNAGMQTYMHICMLAYLYTCMQVRNQVSFWAKKKKLLKDKQLLEWNIEDEVERQVVKERWAQRAGDEEDRVNVGQGEDALDEEQ